MACYYNLWECTCLIRYSDQYDTIIRMILQIKEMADIMEGKFGAVREFAFQHAGTFLDVPEGLPLRLPEVEQWGVVLRVLETAVEELPVYITHRDELIRKAAIYRLTYEKAT